MISVKSIKVCIFMVLPIRLFDLTKLKSKTIREKLGQNEGSFDNDKSSFKFIVLRNKLIHLFVSKFKATYFFHFCDTYFLIFFCVSPRKKA